MRRPPSLLTTVALVLVLALTGCLADAGDEAALEANQAPTLAADDLVAVPFTWDGSSPPGAFACLPGRDPCLGDSVGGDWSLALEVDGEPVGLNATVTWAPADPTLQGLEARLWAVPAEGVANRPLGVAIGASPLALVVDEVSLEESETLALTVWAYSKVQDPVEVFVDPVEQPFHVEGAVAVTGQS